MADKVKVSVLEVNGLDLDFQEERSLTSDIVDYDNTVSGLLSTDTKAAIDELKALIDALGGSELIAKQRFQKHFKLNGTGTDNMKIDGSVTPQEFIVKADAVNDLIVSEITFYALVNEGIQFSNADFLHIGALTNGISFSFKTDDNTYIPFDPVKTTEHKLTHIMSGNNTHVIEEESSFTVIRVTHRFDHARIAVRKQGTFVSDDFLKITINDNLTDVLINEIEAMANGYIL